MISARESPTKRAKSGTFRFKKHNQETGCARIRRDQVPGLLADIQRIGYRFAGRMQPIPLLFTTRIGFTKTIVIKASRRQCQTAGNSG